MVSPVFGVSLFRISQLYILLIALAAAKFRMSDEPGHKAMLYFLEVLMNSTGPLTISQLAGRFGSTSFTPEMRAAAGGNESGLRQFLLRYPSLFTIRGNMVSLCDGKDDDDADAVEDDVAPTTSSVPTTAATTNSQSGVTSTPSTGGGTRRGLPDVSVEMEAVQFFRAQLTRRDDRWVPIKSLAGHLSQTTPEIRAVVGPQLEFRRWLLRHVHIFDVQGDVVALCDGLPGVIPTGASGAQPQTPQRRITFDIPDVDHPPAPAAPKTPPPQRRSAASKASASSSSASSSLHRSHSFSESRNTGSSNAAVNQTAAKRPDAPVTMTANEYKAVMFVKDVLERRGPLTSTALSVQAVPATDSVRTTLGSTPSEFGAFVRKHPGIFEVDGDVVSLVKNAKLSVIITGSRPAPPPPPPPTAPSGRSLTGKGKIFHVAKLWGIVDLGEHEHVFFDRSIMRRPMDDLQRHYHTGEMLSFHAVLAHKSSRARWKATHVWKDTEQEPSVSSSEDALETTPRHSASSSSLSQAAAIEDEVNEFLPKPDRESVSSDPSVAFSDADLSGAGSVSIWNFRQDEERTGRPSVTVVPENYQMSASALSDLRFAPDFGKVNSTAPRGAINSDPSSLANGPVGGKLSSAAPKPKKFVSVACQTISTSDIIATQLYQDI